MYRRNHYCYLAACLTLAVLLAATASADSHKRPAKPGVEYEFIMPPAQLILENKSTVNVKPKFKWSICDNSIYKREVGIYRKYLGEEWGEISVKYVMWIEAAKLNAPSSLLSNDTFNRIARLANATAKSKGICIHAVVLEPYNQSPNSDAQNSRAGWFNRVMFCRK